jgi:DNA-binding NarL/FixJ family response regulator
MIRLLIVDDQSLVREGLIALLSLQSDLQVVGEGVNGLEAIALADEKMPDVILMDISMPICDGVTATERIHKKHPQIKIMVLTTFDDDSNISRALSAGASAYILKNIPSRQLADSVRLVTQGHALILGPNIAPKVMSRFRAEEEDDESEPVNFGKVLTGREMDVFRLLADGKTNHEIAEELCLTEGTVKNYISKVIQNTGARDRMQAVIWSQKYVRKLRSTDGAG